MAKLHLSGTGPAAEYHAGGQLYELLEALTDAFLQVALEKYSGELQVNSLVLDNAAYDLAKDLLVRSDAYKGITCALLEKYLHLDKTTRPPQ